MCILEQRDIQDTDLFDCTDKQQLLGKPGYRAEVIEAVRGICVLPEQESGYRQAQCLAVDDWVFYVVPTFVIDGYCKKNPAQRKISLNVVKRLAKEGSIL